MELVNLGLCSFCITVTQYRLVSGENLTNDFYHLQRKYCINSRVHKDFYPVSALIRAENIAIYVCDGQFIAYRNIRTH